MSALEVFTYTDHTMRTALVDGEPWFVAKDVCAALGITNGRDAVARLDPDGVGSTDVIDSMGRTQHAATVNEAGLYELTAKGLAELHRRLAAGEQLAVTAA